MSAMAGGMEDVEYVAQLVLCPAGLLLNQLLGHGTHGTHGIQWGSGDDESLPCKKAIAKLWILSAQYHGLFVAVFYLCNVA